MAFRVDANPALGIGHLVRCLTLADVLSREGSRACFLTRGLDPSLQGLVAARGHACVPLDGGARQVSEDEDASECERKLAAAEWPWVVVDHYALGAAWERRVAAAGRCILAIDDLADRDHACQVLLDQNEVPAADRRYTGRVPDNCVMLLGPRYALLRPEYAEYRARVHRNGHAPRRVFVFFGGGDPAGLSRLAVDALSDDRLRHLDVDVVCGSAAAADALRRASGRDRLRVHPPQSHLADLMAGADLAIGASGSTTWERLCLGLRSVVVTVADNQLEVARWLSARGLVRLVGAAGTVTAADLRDAVLDEIAAPRHAAVREGMALCDGRGASRVADVMRGLA